MTRAKTVHPYITQDERISRGSPVIRGTRVRVLDIVLEYEYLGRSPDEIVAAHPQLTLAQVHDALSYYYEHREELDAEIHRRKAEVEALRQRLSP